MKAKIIERITEKRLQLQQLQEHDGDAISALRKSIVADEAALQRVKFLQAAIASYEPALAGLRRDVGNRETKIARLRHLAAHAYASGSVAFRYLSNLSALELSEKTVQGIEDQIRQVTVTEPQAELDRIAAEFEVNPPPKS